MWQCEPGRQVGVKSHIWDCYQQSCNFNTRPHIKTCTYVHTNIMYIHTTLHNAEYCDFDVSIQDYYRTSANFLQSFLNGEVSTYQMVRI